MWFSNWNRHLTRWIFTVRFSRERWMLLPPLSPITWIQSWNALQVCPSSWCFRHWLPVYMVWMFTMDWKTAIMDCLSSLLYRLLFLYWVIGCSGEKTGFNKVLTFWGINSRKFCLSKPQNSYFYWKKNWKRWLTIFRSFSKFVKSVRFVKVLNPAGIFYGCRWDRPGSPVPLKRCT